MGKSEETLAEELMKEMTKRINDSADPLQGWGKDFQVGAPSNLCFNIQLGLRRNYADF
jgi:hypothetical protein